MIQKVKKTIKTLIFGLTILGINVSAFYIGSFATNMKWKKELIQRNVAEYNSKTGEWQYSPFASYDLFGQQEPPLPVKEECVVQNKTAKK